MLQQNAVMSSSDYVSDGFKDVSNMTDEGYYISKGFMDRFCVHIAKNFMDLPKIKVPLILGVWGGKGQGKTFQTNLCLLYTSPSPRDLSTSRMPSSA